MSSYLGLSLRGEACPQGVQRLADHCGGARGQTAAHKVNSGRLAVVRRRVVHSLSQELEADKLQVRKQSLLIYVQTLTLFGWTRLKPPFYTNLYGAVANGEQLCRDVALPKSRETLL